jgi:phosphatidylserine/phosphatidylglycerophosphate/cardiolipin synthase-like enzyme
MSRPSFASVSSRSQWQLWRPLAVLFLLCAWAAGCASLPANVQRTPSQAFSAPEQTALGQLVAQRRAADKARSESGFVLLDGVDAAFAARIALVDAAQRTLDLQYYAIHADATTEVLLEHMRAAARRGVRIRLLLDDFNTVGEDTQVLRLAFEPNVQIRLFNPLPGSRGSLITRILASLHDVERIQKRMHNKMFVADSAVGITGGRNLGDAYFGGDGKSAFVDVDVLAAGTIVRDMAASFDHYWNDELAYPMQSLVSAEELEKLRKDAAPQPGDPSRGPAPAASAAQVPLSPTSSVLPNVTPTAVTQARTPPLDLRSLRYVWAPAALLQDKPGKIGPGDDEVAAGDTVVDGLLQLIHGTREEVLIVSPYFVPGARMMNEFRALRARGVRVRVLTNSLASNDAPAAHAGYARYRKDLLALGIELHEMHAGKDSGPGTGGSTGIGGPGGSKQTTSRASLHSKAVVIDRRLSVIGSMNLDLRSQRQNSEVALLIRSPALSQTLSQQIETMINRGAYRLVADGGKLLWRAPPGAPFKDATDEPEADAKLKLLVQVIGPFAPEEML